jgi:hypothetical protein
MVVIFLFNFLFFCDFSWRHFTVSRSKKIDCIERCTTHSQMAPSMKVEEFLSIIILNNNCQRICVNDRTKYLMTISLIWRQNVIYNMYIQLDRTVVFMYDAVRWQISNSVCLRISWEAKTLNLTLLAYKYTRGWVSHVKGFNTSPCLQYTFHLHKIFDY